MVAAVDDNPSLFICGTRQSGHRPSVSDGCQDMADEPTLGKLNF